jgi:hypothetical protein
MKKNLIKVVAYIVSAVLIISTFLTINVFADSNTYDVDRHLENTATLYFSHLYNNFANDQYNNCPYVAISMLLSYYDSFWNDRFISDEKSFDASGEFEINTMNVINSPGINRDYTYTSGIEGLEEAIDSFDTFFFVYELMRIGREVLGFDNITNEEYGWGLETDQEIELLETYLYQYAGFTTDEVEVKYLTYDQEGMSDLLVRNKAKELIQQGTPVLFSGYPSNSSLGHIMIAYDYDAGYDADGDIYFHTGWYHDEIFNGRSIMKESTIANIYSNSYSIIWLEIDESLLGHACAENYSNSMDAENYCMCLFPEHPEHNHLRYSTYAGYTSNNHTIYCLGCQESYTFPHDYGYSLYSNDKHRIYCMCGYSNYLPHVWGNKVGLFRRCLLCSALEGSGDIQYNSIGGNITYITDSGSYMLDNGVIYLSEADVELYYLGELDLNELINQNNYYAR